jgi:hypothetical protein
MNFEIVLDLHDTFASGSMRCTPISAIWHARLSWKEFAVELSSKTRGSSFQNRCLHTAGTLGGYESSINSLSVH